MARHLIPVLSDFVRRRAERRGQPQVHEEQGVRCLRFDHGVVQSAMRVEAPFELDLSYTRTMMGFLLFNPEPRHIVVIGLGGGSLSKYCYHALPEARVTTLEISAEVIALRDQFLIPPDDERFRIVQADGADHLARHDLQADVLMVDGYDAEGLPAGLCSESFYANSAEALETTGVLVANLWGGEPKRTLYLERLRRVFGDRVWWSRPRDSSSLIVFAVKDPGYRPQWSRLMEAAHRLDARHRLDFVSIVNDLRAPPAPEP